MDRMRTEIIDKKRRRLMITAAIGTMGIAVAGAAGLLPSQSVAAQLPGITRTDLMQYDLSVPGREVIRSQSGTRRHKRRTGP